MGAALFGRNDDWEALSRYMIVKAFARIDTEGIDPISGITIRAACSCPQAIPKVTPADGRDPWSRRWSRRGTEHKNVDLATPIRRFVDHERAGVAEPIISWIGRSPFDDQVALFA
jgi:hypothetical protein